VSEEKTKYAKTIAQKSALMHCTPWTGGNRKSRRGNYTALTWGRKEGHPKWLITM